MDTLDRSHPSRLTGLLLIGTLLLATGCSKADTPPPGASRATVPAEGDEIARGAALFGAHCSRCHGERGSGTDQGPPLVHKIYEPSHHPDAAFYRAASMGVKAHHWHFGDMPRVAAVNGEDMRLIIAYVRSLQREAGIY